LEHVLKLALKHAESAEVFSVVDEEIPVAFEANKLKHIQAKQSSIVALRIIKDGRIGYAVSTGSDEPEGLVAMAVETAEFGMEAKYELPYPQDYLPVQTFDPAVERISLEEMVRLGQAMVDAAVKANPEILCDAGASKHIASIGILNSNGLEAHCRSSLFSLGLGGSIIRGTDMLFVGDSHYSSHPVDDAAPVIRNVLRQLEWAGSQAKISSKTMPVIFTPHGVENALIAPLASAFSGKMVLEGASPLKNRLGQRVFDPALSIDDDATLDYQPASSPFDDEGVATRTTALIRDGVVENFYYDLYTASLAGTSSTGNGNRSGGGLPGPAVNALAVKPGTTSFEEMLADIKEGLIIEHLMGADQGNILGGEFSGNVLLGYKIENGKITGRVKNTMVHGSVYELLNGLAAIGNDARWVGGSLYTPSIYCRSIAVAAE